MADEYEPVWRALADPVRRAILDALTAGPLTTGQICERFPLTRIGVMKHIAVLERAGLLTFERRGRERFNHLNAPPLAASVTRWLGRIQRDWAGRLDRLGDIAKEKIDMAGQQQGAMLDIRQEVVYAAAPAAVFRALTHDIGRWWTAPYRQTGEASSLALKPEPGAPMIEIGADGHAAIWATVEEVRPDALLALVGRFGMRGAVAGQVRFEIEALKNGCRLVVQHRAVGALDDETVAMFTGGWRELLEQRLARFLRE